jgi:hypothetical protein
MLMKIVLISQKFSTRDVITPCFLNGQKFVMAFKRKNKEEEYGEYPNFSGRKFKFSIIH